VKESALSETKEETSKAALGKEEITVHPYAIWDE
jgi:hypothetical protein